MKAIDSLNVGFIMTGKMYKGVKSHAAEAHSSRWATLPQRLSKLQAKSF